jgi:lysozyme
MINEEGLGIITHFEGWSSKVYADPIGIPTIGYGSIWDKSGDRVTMAHEPISKTQGTELLQREIQHIEQAIEKLIITPLTANQFSALCSLTYNIGSGNLQSSTLRRMINRWDYIGASDEFPKWRRAGGQILRGLVIRREREQDLFLTI